MLTIPNDTRLDSVVPGWVFAAWLQRCVILKHGSNALPCPSPRSLCYKATIQATEDFNT